MSLLNFEAFRNGNFETQSQQLEYLFERSKSLEIFTIGDPLFVKDLGSSYDEFVEKVRARLIKLCRTTGCDAEKHLSDVIAAHPRLGQTKKVLSAHSALEQRNLGSSDSKETQEILQRLNEQYEAVYLGLRFVVFVNGRSRPEIIRVMQSRINSGNSWLQEAQLACNEMCDIALDRIKKDTLTSQSHNKL
ncbi:LAME_0B06040g1_1 [Lachancea meyersii CBS 8951]|uniref:LAME_0B06040g1_1 n=1 Tax=Lachancea meyersii CBS 8951 TaxID=1266667 RepID=A0A1G4IWL0_9SACH|nr:LAME_0B06040g1_1 [Lachancea meyersii CBS 8951]